MESTKVKSRKREIDSENIPSKKLKTDQHLKPGNSGYVDNKQEGAENIEKLPLHSPCATQSSRFSEKITNYLLSTSYAIAKDMFNYISFLFSTDFLNLNWPEPDHPTFLTPELQGKLAELISAEAKQNFRWLKRILEPNSENDYNCLLSRSERFEANFFIDIRYFVDNRERDECPLRETRDKVLTELYRYCLQIVAVAIDSRNNGNIMASLVAVERIHRVIQALSYYGYLDVSVEWFGMSNWSGNLE